jgi:macrolide-specific efflux system membrane fusion protein
VPQDFRLREGLTVTVSITAEQRTNILLVPNKAITSRSGRYYVQLVSGVTTTEKVIQTGITDGQNTEVISGLNEGDVVSTATNITATTTTTSSQQRTTTSQQRTPTTSIPGVRLP